MLPHLSCLSVSSIPESRLRHRCSSRYQHISPLHREFRSPLLHSSMAVSGGVPWLSHGISRPTHHTTYAPFTPSKSEQRSPPLYYRGCWHRVGRGFLFRYHHFTQVLAGCSFFRMTGVYDPKAFVLHAVSLCQAFAHCKRSSTAASRRSLGSVSVPVRLVILSDQLPVSLGRPLPYQLADGAQAPLQAAGPKVPAFGQSVMRRTTTFGISPPFGGLSPT